MDPEPPDADTAAPSPVAGAPAEPADGDPTGHSDPTPGVSTEGPTTRSIDESTDPPGGTVLRNRRTRVATALMVPALAALAVSAVLFVVPVSNPGVQECGAPAWFLLTAETDAPLVDTDGRAINGWDEQRLRQAHEERCSVRVADRAVPAGVLLGGFWVLGLAASVVGWTGRRALRKSTLT